MTTVTLTTVIVILAAFLISAFYFLDRLIRHEYQFYRDAWEQDGKPTGYIFRPPEATWLGSGFAFQRVAFGWLFSTPPWTRNDSTAKRLLSRLRWCVLIWNVGIIIFFVLLLASGAAR
jgi:hypothetical protein